MPCLDEAETLATCIGKAKSFLARSEISGEVLIADNGSTDGSQRIAESLGARVVSVKERGYGSALMGGILAARGRYVIMGDADDSYDFAKLDNFIEELRHGADLVMGNRFRGGIAPGAMPVHHRYLGNPVLSSIGRLFFRSPSKDFHCGLRGFKRAAIQSLHLSTTGMEFASEMLVKASLHGLEIVEVPTTLSQDGRSRPPHLRSWRDGWRHLRFLLLFSPRWLFLYPGLAMIAFGMSLMLALISGPIRLGSLTLDVNTLLYSGVLVLVGLECVIFSVFTKIFGINSGLLPIDSRMTRLLERITLERGLLLAFTLILLGLIGLAGALYTWARASFGPIDNDVVARVTVPSAIALASGIQVGFASFFVSILQIGQSSREPYRKRERSVR